MSSMHSSGKTAPRLVLDIHQYDPTQPPASGRNLLSEVPPTFASDYQGPLEAISPRSCDHEYTTKVNQSTLSTGGSSSLFAICSKCRHHLQFTVNDSGTVGQHGHGLFDHIHHLVCRTGKASDTAPEVTFKGQRVESYYYECSYLACPTSVSVYIASPILNDGFVSLLTNDELLRKRTEEAVAAHPTRLEGVGKPLAIEVIRNLRTYIVNALRDHQHSKSITAVNKRFMSCFGVEGQPCKDLLEFLEFTYKDEGVWEPPHFTGPPYHDPRGVFLDDVTYELSVLIDQRPLSEKKGHQVEPYGYSAFDQMLTMLSCLNYPKASRLHEFQMAQIPCYEDLGTAEDMSSELIIEAYNRQISVDPARSSLYLKSLKVIGDLRRGQDGQLIDRVVQEAYAEGKYTDDELIAAYEYFGFRRNDPSLTDEDIIGKFHAFLKDTGHETETRKQLWTIGDWRRSEQIKSAAEDRVSTMEQAMVFLGVEDTTPDDFVIAMYTTKINDAPTSKDLAHRAVELIAEGRNSATLREFAKTGNTTGGEMDVGEAYRLLQIPDRTVDEESIVAAYTICVDEAPGQADLYHQALRVIATETGSHQLRDMVSLPMSQPDRDLSEWPVGLQNIGNTCYLNSLLQFYFSLRPFREMVLEYEKFKMELNGETLSKKQVGSRKVLRKEVLRSQSFLRELQILFLDMITSPYSSVTPRRELARLTLISPSNEAAIRRRSTMSKPQGLGDINGMPVLGPLGPPHIMTEIEQGPQSGGATVADSEKPPQTSITEEPNETAPASEGMDKPDASTSQVDDKENAPPSTDVTMKDSENDQPSEQNPAEPPPVPPRPVQDADRQRQLIEEVEMGAQQDVTEVINNVLFQSQCAIKPYGISPDGEQLDQIKDLFYGRSKSYISAKEGLRSKEEWWCDIKVDVATGSRDIHTAIDGAFDVQKIAVDNTFAEQFSAISKLPPVLQIQVQRVQFDPMKKSSFKSTHHLDLRETIYLDRYMDTSRPDIVNRRQENWRLKDSLKNLEARRVELLRQNEETGDMPKLVDSVHGVLEDLNSLSKVPETEPDSIDVEPQFLEELEQLANITKSELVSVEKEIESTKSKISHQFDDYKALPYRLYAVFIHHGSVNFGHYWIYIFDFKKNVWRKYNDTYVTEVQNLDEIFKNQEEQNPPTPYFLVYVNDAMKDRLVSPVHRDIVKDQAPPSDQENVSAEGYVTNESYVPCEQDYVPGGENVSGGVNEAFWDEWGRCVHSADKSETHEQSYGNSKQSRDAPDTGGDGANPTKISPRTNPLKRKSFDDAMEITKTSENPA